MSNRLRVSHFTSWIKLSDDEYVLLNPCYGSVAFVDREVIELLSTLRETQDQESLPSSKILEKLADNGFLTEKTIKEEMNSVGNLKNTFYHRTHSVKHGFIITYDCNLRCVYCYESSLWKKPRKWLQSVVTEHQVDEAYKIIEKKKNQNQKAMPISLYGGEPLMLKNIEAVEYVLKKGHQRGYSFDANTNGITIKEYIDLLRRYQVAIGVTLDGPKKVHDKRRIRKDGRGSFDDIVEGIDLVLEKGLSAGVRVNVDRSNIDKLPDLAAFAMGKGWHEKKQMSFFICQVAKSFDCDFQDALTWDELIRRIVELRKRYSEMELFKYDWDEGQMNSFSTIPERGCPPPRDIFCLAHSGPVLLYDPYGDVYSCAKFVGSCEHKIGTYTHGLRLNDNFQLWQNRKVLNINECKKCHNSLMCGGGCAYNALLEHGSLMKPFCEEFMATIKWHVPYTFAKNREYLEREQPS